MVAKLIPNGTSMAAKWALEASWRSLGVLLELLKRLGRPRGGFQGRMGRSWTPLGGLRALKLTLLGYRKVTGSAGKKGQWGLPGAYGALLDASWGALGAVRGRKRLILTGSWPAQERRGDRIRMAWGPNDRLKKGPRGCKNLFQNRSKLKM